MAVFWSFAAGKMRLFADDPKACDNIDYMDWENARMLLLLPSLRLLLDVPLRRNLCSRWLICYLADVLSRLRNILFMTRQRQPKIRHPVSPARHFCNIHRTPSELCICVQSKRLFDTLLLIHLRCKNATAKLSTKSQPSGSEPDRLWWNWWTKTKTSANESTSVQIDDITKPTRHWAYPPENRAKKNTNQSIPMKKVCFSPISISWNRMPHCNRLGSKREHSTLPSLGTAENLKLKCQALLRSSHNTNLHMHF